jgi:hypothetical protein
VTWYANRIYLNATPAVFDRLRAMPALVGHIFHLTGTLPAGWEPNAGSVPLPDGGLVVVKEVCDPSDPGDWYPSDAVASWHALRGSPDTEVVDADIGRIYEGQRPPKAFLQFLKDLHAATGVPVTYYSGRTWGGLSDGEFAWTFAATEVVYARLSETETAVLAHDGRRVVRGDVHVLALAHHGVHLSKFYFAPHTRVFDWDSYRRD